MVHVFWCTHAYKEDTFEFVYNLMQFDLKLICWTIDFLVSLSPCKTSRIIIV